MSAILCHVNPDNQRLKKIGWMQAAFLLLAGLLVPRLSCAGSCWPAASDSSSGVASSAWGGTSAWDISSLLGLTTSVTDTMSVNWTGYMACPTVLWYSEGQAYYLSPIETGFFVKFTDESSGGQQWVKFTSRLDAKGRQNFAGLKIQSYPVESLMPLGYTLIAELVDEGTINVAMPNIGVTTTGSFTIPVAVAATRSTLKELDAQLAFASGNWPSVNWITYQYVTVTYKPPVTTCTVPDQLLTLPKVSLHDLRNGNSGDTSFSIPVNCSGSIANNATRAVNIRLYSPDIVDGTNTIIRNRASTSNGVGFQLFNSTTNVLRFTDAPDSASTSLWGVAKGGALPGGDTMVIGARYKIFNAENASGGSVVGTVIAYAEYD